MPAAITERRFTVSEAAARLSVNPETIRRAIRSGELKASRNRLAPGSPFLVADSDLRAFVEARTA